MRNSRSNFIPVPKSVKNSQKSLPRLLAQRKSSSCQTERVVLIKEENLSFHPVQTRIGHNDGGMRRDYLKAVNYINSCHKFINTIIEKNATDKSSMFLLPMVTNFIPIFSYLIGKKSTKSKERNLDKLIEKRSTKSTDRKSKSNFAVKKIPEETPIDPIPVGDCGKNVQETEDDYTSQITAVFQEQIKNFFNAIQDDMNKAMRKSKSDTPTCKNLDIVKQRLEEFSKIFYLQKNIESNPQIVQMASLPRPATPPPPPNASTDCSVILSDHDSEEVKVKSKTKTESTLQITMTGKSAASLLSETSDIKSDSDFEIKT